MISAKRKSNNSESRRQKEQEATWLEDSRSEVENNRKLFSALADTENNALDKQNRLQVIIAISISFISNVIITKGIVGKFISILKMILTLMDSEF